jgi:predicted DNA-binding transcriptional regulator AlpA
MSRSADNRHRPAADEGRTARLTVSPGPGESEPTATSFLQAGTLISIREIRALFGLGRTAAYELTHRTGFPAPVRISPRCYRWWAAEVAAFTADLRRQAQPCNRQRPARQPAPAHDIPALHITGKVRVARRRKEAGAAAMRSPATAPAASPAAP